MKNKTILEVHQALMNHEISVSELISQRIALTKQAESENYNAFLTTFENEALAYAKKLDSQVDEYKDYMLFGIPGTIKDNLNVKGYRTTGASRSLDKFISTYNAEAVTHLYNDKSVFLAKTNLDEFGFGGTGTHSGYGIVKNPIHADRITGGSSSGSAVSVYLGIANYSVATDTGDSIRKPASFLGLVGYKPSYGLISRYGVLPFSSSLDHVGMFGNDVTDIAIVMDSLVKFDPKDFTSIQLEKTDFYKNIKPAESLKILVLDDVVEGLDEDLKVKFNQLVNDLGSKYQIVHANFNRDLLDIIPILYKAIAYSEGASNWNNLTGITFGKQDGLDYSNYIDLMYQIRSNYLGSEIKRRMVVGNWFTSHENFADVYQKSKMIRSALIGRANQVLENVDVVLMPGASTVASKLTDVLNRCAKCNYTDDALQIANFAGLPSITIPFSQDEELNPFGINLWTKKYHDQDLLNAALSLEQFIKERGYRHE